MIKKLALGGFTALLAAVVLATSASAASTVIVTPTDTEGWSTADTRPGGAVNYVADATSPFPDGALQLTTDDTTTAKAQYLHEASTTLAEVTDLSYYTKQISGPTHAAASYQLLVDLNGTTTGGFTTFVYEPYQNGTVASGTWQQWDVDAGQFWSSRSFTEGTCSVEAGGGGAPFYSLEDLQTDCPGAVVIGFGVNIGSNNPGYDVYTDGVVFNGVTYDFEVEAPVTAPADKDACKNGGWMTFTNPSFKNQGECVSSVTSNR
ncbi:MAG: hypothetical protein V4526_01230 [Patescibacteria group bacterium]